MKINGKPSSSSKKSRLKYPLVLASILSANAYSTPVTIDTEVTASSPVTIGAEDSDYTISSTGSLVIPDDKTDCVYDIDAEQWNFTNNGEVKSTAPKGHHIIHYRESGDYEIVNNGTISLTGSEQDFVFTEGASVNFNVTNSGTISTGAASAFLVDNSSASTFKLDNKESGVISSDSGKAIYIKDSNETVTIENAGEISGKIAIDSASQTTIHNSGKIVGDETAISLGSKDDEVVLETTSDIEGDVNAGGGTDILTLQGDSGEDSLDLSQYTNFETFNKNGKGTWTLTDTNSEDTKSAWGLNDGKLIIAKDAVLNGSVNVSDEVTENVALEVNGKIDNGTDAAIDFESDTTNQLIYNTGASLGAGGLNIGAGEVYLTGNSAIDSAVNIDGGSLYIGDGEAGTGGSVETDISNNGNVVFNHADDYTFNNVISGTGTVEKDGAGNVILTKDQTYTGDTTVNSGALILTNDITLASANVTVAEKSTFGGYGTVAGNVTNNGVIAVADATPGYEDSDAGAFIIQGDLTNNGQVIMGGVIPSSTLTVEGNYTGNNGSITLDMALNDDTTSSGDLMIIKGDTSGTTNVTVNNAGGMGGQTIEGIEVIEVDGQSDGDFVQQGRIVAGAYDYYLTKGTTSNPDDGSWYLRSETEPAPIPDPEPTPEPEPAPVAAPVRPEAGSYLGNQSAAKAMFMSTMHDRMGEQQFMKNTDKDELDPSTWVRVAGSRTEGKSAGSIDQSTDSSMFQLGSDITNWSSNGSDSTHIGFLFGYGYANTDSYSALSKAGSRHSVGKVKGYNTGLYGTWYQNAKDMTGLYIDSSLQYSWFDNETKGEQLSSEKYDSDLWQVSVETGYSFLVDEHAEKALYIEPQAQVIYSAMDTEDQREQSGTLINSADNSGYTTRLGTRIFGRVLKNSAMIQPFMEANWWHDTAANSMKMNEDKVYNDTPSSYYEVKGGVEAKINNSLHSWVNVGYQTGENDYSQITGMVGIKYNW